MPRKRVYWCAVCVWVCLASSALAQAPETYLPRDTLAFVSLPDMDGTRERLDQTALAKIWGEPSVQQFLVKPKEALRKALDAKLGEAKAAINAQTGLSVADFQGVFAGQATFALMDLDLDRRPAGVSAALVLGIRDREKFDATFGKLDALMPAAAEKQGKALEHEVADMRGQQVVVWSGPDGRTLCRATAKGLCLLTSDRKSMDLLLAGLQGAPDVPTLANSRPLAIVKERIGGSGLDLVAYLNPSLLLSKPDIGPDVEQALDAFGVSDIKALLLAVAITPPGIKDMIYVYAPEPRRGLLNLVEPRNVSQDLLALVPADAQTARIGRFDLLHAWEVVTEALETANPQASAALQAGLAQFEMQAQLSLEDSLLASLGENFVVSAGPAGAPGLGAVGTLSLLWEVRAPDVARDALDKTADFIVQAIQAKRGPQASALPWREMPHGEHTVRYLTLPLPIASPTYAVTQKYLVFGLQPMAVKLAIDRLGKPGKDVRSKPDFQQVTSHVSSPSVMLGYADLKQSFYQTYMMAPMLLGLAQAKSGNKLPLDVAAMPPATAITQHLFGAAGSLTCDDEGIAAEYYSPIGGATAGVVIGGGAAAAILGFRAKQVHVPAPAAK